MYSSLVVTALVLVTIPCWTQKTTHNHHGLAAVVDAFVPQRHNEYDRYHRRIANTQLHYVKVDDTSGLEELMDLTAIVRESIRVSERSLTELRHFVSELDEDDEEDQRQSSISSSIQDMASFVVSRFSSTTSTTIPAGLDPIKVMRTAGTFVPETFTLPSSLTPLSLVPSKDESILHVPSQMGEQDVMTMWNPSSSVVHEDKSPNASPAVTSSTSSSLSSSTIAATSIHVMDAKLPFFVKRRQPSPPGVPFFASVVVESKPKMNQIPLEVMTVETTDETKSNGDSQGILSRPKFLVDFPAIVLAWPKILRPSATVQEALHDVQEAFGAVISTTASRMVHSLSTLAQEYYDAATPSNGLAKDIPMPPQLSAEQLSIVTNAMEDAKLYCGAMVGHVVDSVSKLLSPDIVSPMGPFVSPHPPQSTPSLALFLEQNDDQEQMQSTITSVTGKDELDLEEIDSVLMEAEWALKFAEAAFQ